MRGTVIFDLDGVLYLGEEVVPGAGGVLARIEAAGMKILFSTNNSWRTQLDGASKIRRVTGYEAEPGQFISSSIAAASLLAPTDGPALIMGGPGIEEAIGLAGLERTEDPAVAGVVVAGLDRNLNYDNLARAASAVRRGARFIATNLDATFPTPHGLMPGAGSMIAALRTAAETEPEVAGKPFEPMRAILNELSGEGPRWMVGDRPDTDLAMAQIEGWTSILVLTGVTSTAEGVEPRPDLVLDSVSDLPPHLGL